MVEIYNKEVEHKAGTEWVRVTPLSDGREKIEAIHDATGKMTKAEVIKRFDKGE